MKNRIILFILVCSNFILYANPMLVGAWRGVIVGHVDNRDYFINATIENKKKDIFDIKLNLFSNEYSGDFVIHTTLKDNKLFIGKLDKIKEFPYPYLHIEDCFSGYFLLKPQPDNTMELDLYRTPVYHKIEEFTNIDGDGNFVPGFECFTSVLLRSKMKDTVMAANEKQAALLIATKKKRADELADRKVVSAKKCFVKNTHLVLQVWDNNTQDGDIISLKLNNTWILTDFPLKKEKHTIPIQLKKPENELLLFAENLGKIPPNTASISINDSMQLKTYILNSDMKKSETIKINYIGKK